MFYLFVTLFSVTRAVFFTLKFCNVDLKKYSFLRHDFALLTLIKMKTRKMTTYKSKNKISKKSKIMQGITAKEKVYTNNASLVTWISNTIHNQMNCDFPCWDKNIDGYLMWSDNNP